jgi:MFS family permease
VASIGEGWCFFANAVSYIAVIIGLFLMNVQRHERVHHPGSPLSHVAEGFRFVTQNSPVHALLILLGIVSLAGTPFAVLMPIFADRVLHGGAATLGWLMGATGVGALVGALLLASRQSLDGLGRWVAVAATGFGVGLALFSLSRTFWLSSGILVLMGFALMIQMGSSNTLIQSMVPDRLRGRVMAVYSMMLMGMSPIGSLLAGAAADHIGAPLTVAAGGGICTIAAFVFWLRLPHLRVLARKLIVAQQLAGVVPPPEMDGGNLELEQTRE